MNEEARDDGDESEIVKIEIPNFEVSTILYYLLFY